MDRRQFLSIAGALIAAPAIVRASSLMPVRSLYDDEAEFMAQLMATIERDMWRVWKPTPIEYISAFDPFYPRVPIVAWPASGTLRPDPGPR